MNVKQFREQLSKASTHKRFVDSNTRSATGIKAVDGEAIISMTPIDMGKKNFTVAYMLKMLDKAIDDHKVSEGMTVRVAGLNGKFMPVSPEVYREWPGFVSFELINGAY